MEVIDDAETLQEWIDKSDDIVVGACGGELQDIALPTTCHRTSTAHLCLPFSVVDLFKKWCGYCSVMEPTYNTLFLDLENFEERVKLLAVSDGVGLCF